MVNVPQQNHPTFLHLLSEENKHLLLLQGREISASRGKVLLYEGEEAKYIYLIRSGLILLSKNTLENKQFYLHLKQKDDIIGEYSLFNNMSSSMSAETVTDSQLIRFHRNDLESLFTQNGEIASAFIQIFARNTQSTQAKFSDFLLHGKAGAFYSVLIRFANSYGIQHSDGIKINIKLTNKDMAHFIGTSRETVNRLLNDLRRDNIILVRNNSIIIKDMDFLKRHLHCEKCPIPICTIS